MIMFFENNGRKKIGGFYLKFCLDKKRGNKNDFKNTLCQVTRDSGQSCLNWQHKRRRKLVLVGKFRCNVHGNFFGVERILQTMSKTPSIFAIILVLLLHHIQESKAQCLKISQNLSFLRFSIFILQIFEL